MSLKLEDLDVVKNSSGKIVYVIVRNDKKGKLQTFADITEALSPPGYLQTTRKTILTINGIKIYYNSAGYVDTSKVKLSYGQVLYTFNDSDWSGGSISTNRATVTRLEKVKDDSNEYIATWSWNETLAKTTDNYEYKWYYGTGLGVWIIGSEGTSDSRQSTYTPPEEANKIKFIVKPIATKNSGTDKPKWTADWSIQRIVDFRNDNPKEIPNPPTVEIEGGSKLTVTLDNIDPSPSGINTKIINSDNYGKIRFKIYKRDSEGVSTVKETVDADIIRDHYGDTGFKASYKCNVLAGYKYYVICRGVKGDNEKDYLLGPWSEESEEVMSKPTTISDFSSIQATSKSSIRLVWPAVSSAESYEIQWTTDIAYFDGYNEVNSVSVDAVSGDKTVSKIIDGIEKGFEVFFRIRAINSGGKSNWSKTSSIILGTKPSPPTTWSSSSIAVNDGVSSPLYLYWVHNSTDGSSQTYADIELIKDDNYDDSEIISIANSTDPSEIDRTGSYQLDTSKYPDGTNVKWRVRTEGILNRETAEKVKEINDTDAVADFIEVAKSYLPAPDGDSRGLKYGNGSWSDYKYYTALNKTYYTKYLNYEEPSVTDIGNPLTGIINSIDCSTYVTLALMGIEYHNSPYTYYNEIDDDTIDEAITAGNACYYRVYTNESGYFVFDPYTAEIIDPSDYESFDLYKLSENCFVESGVLQRVSYVSYYDSDGEHVSDISEITDLTELSKKTFSTALYYAGNDPYTSEPFYYCLLGKDGDDFVDNAVFQTMVTETVTIDNGSGESTKQTVTTHKIMSGLEIMIARSIFEYELDPGTKEGFVKHPLSIVYEDRKSQHYWASDIISLCDEFVDNRVTAAAICQMMESSGRRVEYEANDTDGLANVRPGDIIFFAAKEETEGRYRGISHVSIVTETSSLDPYNKLRIIEVTTKENACRQILLKNKTYSGIPSLEKIVSICRPVLKSKSDDIYKTSVDYMSDWSLTRNIDIYSQPSISLRMVDSAGDDTNTLTEFPVRFEMSTTSSQTPIICSIDIKSNQSYRYNNGFGDRNPDAASSQDEYFDNVTVMPGDIVFSKVFNNFTGKNLNITINPGEINLKNNIQYEAVCTVSFDSGLSATDSIVFSVGYEDVEPIELSANIDIDKNNLISYIRPYCTRSHTEYYYAQNVNFTLSDGKSIIDAYVITDQRISPDRVSDDDEVISRTVTIDDETVSYPYIAYRSVTLSPDDELVTGEEIGYVYVDETGTLTYVKIIVEEPVTSGYSLSVYRRDYDGGFTLIHENVDGANGFTTVDPHPALDYARYRIMSLNLETGQNSFYDVDPVAVGEKAIIIQWDESWRGFSSMYGIDDVVQWDQRESLSWGGTILRLPYNVDISNSNNLDIETVEYIGRKHPVTYYGTHLGETATWSAEIDKKDTETLYLFRRLASYMGDVYVREPSGSGYHATVKVSFNQTHNVLTIPITIDVTRVEGGV